MDQSPTSPHAARGSEAALFEQACVTAREAAVLASVEAALGWDERTLMPPKAASYRGEQAAAIAGIVHAKRTDPARGELLATLAASHLASQGAPEIQAAIRLMAHDYEKQARLPVRLVTELAKTCVDAQQAWMAARAESSWTTLAPWLEKVFALKREQASCQRPDLDPYDSLLDDYEPGGRWPAVAERFERLRTALVPLVRGCVESSSRPSDSVMRRHYPIRDQERFVRAVAERIGFDFQRGRLDTTDHPFCSTLGPDDCRITTRWDDSYLPTALFGVLHEAGHGLYEQGLPREWFGLPPGEAASLGIHESQSRLWENLVGRSPEFWEWCFPVAREFFPEALAGTTAADAQAALLVVEPSFIRVEADEVTYNLHVMMRFDLERAIVHGDLAVADLPAAWNERFEKDFGRRPPTDAEGVLQDIHWSAGLIGYFPTYTLGNMFAAQLMEAAERAIPGLGRQMAAGQFGDLLGWLRRQVHASGRTHESEPLVERVTGEPASERWLVESLFRRYGPAYGLT
jgi:carboxypeptidase Taq